MNSFGLLATEVTYITIASSIGVTIEQQEVDNNLVVASFDAIKNIDQQSVELSINEQSSVNLEQVEIT